MDTSKIIRGVVSNGRYTVTAPIIKEDYGLYLQIEGVELPSTYEVDFSNSENSGTSVTMIGNADGVRIPRQFIDTGKDVFAFLYHVGEDFGRTVYKFRIPNKLRPDRTDEEPTPEEQSTIDQAISVLNTAVAKTAQDVISADKSARSASDNADRAESAMDTAGEYANDAQNSAESASESARVATEKATASAESASASAQIKADVEDLVDDAQASANASAQSASQASASEQGCARAVSNATSAAAIARARAEEASGYAQTASTKAQDASGYAQTASTKATESAQSASQALSYKTDAESAKTASQTAQGLAESARDTAVSAKTDAESARDDAVQAKEDAESAVASIADALDEKAPIITDTASGSIASFSDGADGLPLKSLVIDINPIQDLSNGDPSPENICPISGWTEVDVEQRGVNLFDNGMTLEDGYISPDTGQVTASQNAYNKHTPLIPIAPSISLVANKVQALAANNALRTFFAGWAYYDINKNFISGKWNPSATDTPPTNARFLVLSVTGSATNNNYFTPETIADFVKDYCLAYGSSVTPYEPYTGRSITIDLGQTVYGGKLDVLSGELVIDRAIVDLVSLDWSTYPLASNCFKALLSDGKVTRTNYSADGICSSYAKADYITTLRDTDSTFGVGYSNLSTATCYVAVHDSRFTDATAFKTAMSGVMLCYELAEPIEIQLSANQINSLYGVNNLWADSGDTTAEYRADTKLYIAKKIAEALASLT